MLKKSILILSLICSFPVIAKNDIENVNEKSNISTTTSTINYGDYKSYSELVNKQGKIEEEKSYVFPKIYFDNLQRIGDVNEDENIRIDVYNFIKSQKVSFKEEELLKKFAQTLQTIFYLNPNEIIRPNNLVYLNVNLLSSSICAIKESKTDDETKKMFKLLKEIEAITINTNQRLAHYKILEKLTKEINESEEAFMPQIFMAAYEICFDKKPTQNEIQDVFNKIDSILKNES